MLSISYRAVLLSLASLAAAQYGGYGGVNGGGPGNNGNPNNGGPGNFGENGPQNLSQLLQSQRGILVAHGVLAAAAFVVFFPAGAILIRLGNFRGLWLAHAVIQALAYVLYIAAFGIGIWIATHARLLNQAHPIIGIVLFVLIFFQPFLGLAHHYMFKKHSRRVVWSYGHIWLGRIIITLGIINGGLGLQLAQRTRVFAPSRAEIIAYSVVAGVIWLIYAAAAVFGEIKRRGDQSRIKAPPSQDTSPPGTGHAEKSNRVYA